MIATAEEDNVPVRGSYEWAMYYADEWCSPQDEDDGESFGNDVCYRRIGVRRLGWPNPHTMLHYSLQVPPEALCEEDRKALDWVPIYER